MQSPSGFREGAPANAMQTALIVLNHSRWSLHKVQQHPVSSTYSLLSLCWASSVCASLPQSPDPAQQQPAHILQPPNNPTPSQWTGSCRSQRPC